MTSKEIEQLLRGLWTRQDIAAMYGVSEMCVCLWTINRGLPSISIDGVRHERYVPSEVIEWAGSHGLKPRRACVIDTVPVAA